jgi:hypothetical protein
VKCPTTNTQDSLPEGFSQAQATWIRAIIPNSTRRKNYLESREKLRKLSDAFGDPPNYLYLPRYLQRHFLRSAKNLQNLRCYLLNLPKKSSTKYPTQLTTVVEELSADTLLTPGVYPTIWELPSLIYVGPITKELRIRTLPRPFSTSNSSSRSSGEIKQEVLETLGTPLIQDLARKLGVETPKALQRAAAILNTCREHEIDPRSIRWGV